MTVQTSQRKKVTMLGSVSENTVGLRCGCDRNTTMTNAECGPRVA